MNYRPANDNSQGLTPAPGYLLLILNGEISDDSMVWKLAKRSGGIICADGGTRHAERLSLKPGVIIGDMDSYRTPPTQGRRGAGPSFVIDVDPYRSDFVKALDFVLKQGCRSLCVTGVMGGRLDHVLVNLALIERYSRRLEITMVDRGLARILGPGDYRFNFRRGEIITLLALGKAVVSLTGTRYPLKKEKLIASSRGLSNTAQGHVRLRVHSGRLWLAACGA